MNTKQGILFISVALLLFCTFTSVASAKTWYVDDDGGAGIDFTMIQDAINVAKSGETIIVRNGTYTEKVEVYINYLTIKSENGSASTIVQAVSTNDPVFKIISDYVTISDSDSNNVMDNTCSFSKKWHGIYIDRSDSNTIVNNICSSNNWGGIYISDSSDNIIYCNNFINNAYNGWCKDTGNSWNSVKRIGYTYKGQTHRSKLGNYWGDYSGCDRDSNGIGDSSYWINQDKDYYPLMMRFENYV